MIQAEKQFNEWLKGQKNELDNQLLKQLKGKIVLIKYGGNAMVSDNAEEPVLDQISLLAGAGMLPVVVHGGGPSIRKLLEEVGIESIFVDGHRKTDARAMRFVEMALSGEVNGQLVKKLNTRGMKAVGLSGKDASMVQAEQRFHEMVVDGESRQMDIGFVGNIAAIDPSLVHSLLQNGYLPVVSPIGVGPDGKDYNINADMFAGHLAGALKAAVFMAVTDVDGLRKDPADPASHIEEIDAASIRKEMGKSIKGGMIPKVEACLIALEKGVGQACIVHGMKPNRILNQLITHNRSGTTILS